MTTASAASTQMTIGPPGGSASATAAAARTPPPAMPRRRIRVGGCAGPLSARHARAADERGTEVRRSRTGPTSRRAARPGHSRVALSAAGRSSLRRRPFRARQPQTVVVARSPSWSTDLARRPAATAMPPRHRDRTLEARSHPDRTPGTPAMQRAVPPVRPGTGTSLHARPRHRAPPATDCGHRQSAADQTDHAQTWVRRLVRRSGLRARRCRATRR